MAETNRIICGDALAVLRTLPDCCVNMAVTSPPYYGLRDYGVDGQIGLEYTPEAYVSRLVTVFREVSRALMPDGTLWLNIGDSYAGSGKGRNSAGVHAVDGSKSGSYRGQTDGVIGRQHTGRKPKDMLGIPWMLAFAEITYAADIDAKWGGLGKPWPEIDATLKKMLPKLHRVFSMEEVPAERQPAEKESVLQKIREGAKTDAPRQPKQKNHDKSGPEL